MTIPRLSGWVLHKDEGERYENTKLMAAAESEDIELRIVRPNDVDLLVTRSGRRSVRVAGEESSLPDFIVPRTGSGTTYFALAVMRHFERLGVRMFNSAEAIDAVKDKLFSQQILAASDLPVPKTMLVRHPTDPDFVEQSLGFPIVIKTLAGSHGEGVFLAETRPRFVDLMQLIATTAPTVNIILQEFIQPSHGRDLRVMVVGGRAIGAMVRASVDGSFKANISRGGRAEPFAMTANAEWLAMEATRVLGLDIAGVDLLFDGEDQYRICEVNSAPQFEGLETLGEVDVAAQIMHYVKIRLGH